MKDYKNYNEMMKDEEKYFVLTNTNMFLLLSFSENVVFEEIIHLNNINNKVSIRIIAKFINSSINTVIRACAKLIKIGLISDKYELNYNRIKEIYDKFDSLNKLSEKKEYCKLLNEMKEENNTLNNNINMNEEMKEEEKPVEVIPETIETKPEMVEPVEDVEPVDAIDPEKEKKEVSIDEQRAKIKKLCDRLVFCHDDNDFKKKRQMLIDFANEYQLGYSDDEAYQMINMIKDARKRYAARKQAEYDSLSKPEQRSYVSYSY